MGNQLSKFVPHSQPCLETLSLRNVGGIINSDLLALFLAASQTLTLIVITGCQVKRHNPGEEYAIDAAVSRMVKLRDLHLIGYGTALSIERGAPRRYLPSTNTPFREIYISLPTARECQRLPKALQVTGWDSVTVIDADTEADNSLRQELQDIAVARDIDFTIY